MSALSVANAPAAKPSPRLEAVQVLRAVAVAIVVCGHVIHEVSVGFLADAETLNQRFPGGFGVDLFFVISGFIMVFTTRGSTGPGMAGSFFRRRLIRIVPLYWIMTTLMIAAVLAAPGLFHSTSADWNHFLASYFFVPYARAADGAIQPILGLGWTLQYEMYFYLLFAVGLLLPLRFSRWFAAAALVFIMVLGQTALITGTVGRFLGDPVVLEFAMGVGLGWLYVRGFRIPLRLGIGLGILAAIAAALYFILSPFSDDARLFHSGIPAFFIVAAATLSRGIDTAGAPRRLAEIGDASYAIYLTHPFVIGATAYAAHLLERAAALTPGEATVWYVGVVLPASLAVGIFVHNRIDRPLTGWIARHWGSGRERALPPQAASASAGRGPTGPHSGIGSAQSERPPAG